MSIRKMVLRSAVLIASAIAARGALAQEAAPKSATVAANIGPLEEIVVTARRREESSQSVPVAVTAFSQEELTERSVTTPYDVAKFVSGLTTGGDLGNTSVPQFSIRGRGTNYGAAAGSV